MKSSAMVGLSRSARKTLARRLPQNAHVVDVGCGSMRMTYEYIHYSRPDISVTGVEKFENSTIYGPIDVVSPASQTPAFKRIACDIERDPLPFEDGSVDGVFCSHVLEHLADTHFVIGQMLRVLRPGGLLYLEVPGPRALILPKGSLPKRYTETPLSMWDDPTHVRPPFTVEQITELLTASGFFVEHAGYQRELGRLGIPLYGAMFGAGFLPIWPKETRALLISAGWWNLVGWPIYAIAQKRAAGGFRANGSASPNRRVRRRSLPRRWPPPSPSPVEEFIAAHSTVAVERAVLRLLGRRRRRRRRDSRCPTSIVDALGAAASAPRGVALAFGKALAETGLDPRRSAMRSPPAARAGRFRRAVPEAAARGALRPHVDAALARVAGAARGARRVLARLPQLPPPLLYVIVASGNIYEDRTAAVAAAEAGAQIIAVIRSTGQSLLDFVPYGPTTEGFGGTYATQANFRSCARRSTRSPRSSAAT